MGLQDFHSFMRILFHVCLKHTSFFTSADVKPTSDDLMHAVPWQCMH